MPATVAAMPTKGRPQIAVRLDADQIAELDRLAALASTPLRTVSRSDVARHALALGMEALRAELDGAASKAKRPMRKG